MIKVIFDKNGVAYSDFKVIEEAKNIIKKSLEGNVYIHTSTESMIDLLMCAVRDKLIKPEDIEVFTIVDDTELIIRHNSEGEFIDILPRPSSEIFDIIFAPNKNFINSMIKAERK